MLPMFQRELVEKNKWLTEDEMTDIFSISQCLPGVIAVNTAVFVGHRQKGITGGIIAAMGVVLPSLIVIMAIAAFLSNFADIPVVQRAFIGLRVCVSVLIINAVINLRKHSVIDMPTVFIFIAIFLLSIFMILPVAVLIAIAGIIGIVISLLRKHITPKDDAAPADDGPAPPEDGEL